MYRKVSKLIACERASKDGNKLILYSNALSTRKFLCIHNLYCLFQRGNILCLCMYTYAMVEWTDGHTHMRGNQPAFLICIFITCERTHTAKNNNAKTIIIFLDSFKRVVELSTQRCSLFFYRGNQNLIACGGFTHRKGLVRYFFPKIRVKKIWKNHRKTFAINSQKFAPSTRSHSKSKQ